MTSDLSEHTRNIAPYIDGMRPMRRPDASGEFPIITGTRPIGADELARLAATTTLVLPDGPALPPTLRPAVTTVYGPADEDRQKHYRGRHRAAWSPSRWALAGAAALLVVELIAAAVTLAASAVVR